MAAKKLALVGLFAMLVVAGVVAAAIVLIQNKNKNDDNNNNINASQKAIHDLCQKTYYQQSCVDSLSKATNSSDPKVLIETSFQTTIEELGNVIKQSASLQADSRDPQTAEAYKTCQKLLDDSIDDLKRTLDRTESLNVNNDFRIFMDDVKTWLTGALTFQETCLDCFEDVEGDGARTMRELLKLSQELTINGLALANEFSQILVPNGRHLLQGDELDYQYYSENVSWPTRRLLRQGNELGTSTSLVAPKGPKAGYDYVDETMYYFSKEESWPAGTKTRELFQATPGNIRPHVIVAKDGSGKYKTINAALKEAPQKKNETFVIYIKEGVYHEYVTVNKTTWSVMFIGDGPTKTKITGHKSHVGGVGTFDTATVVIEGDNFMGKDVGFENTAGPQMHQAVAIRVSADKSIFHNCQIDGYQDTLYTHTHRQFYRDCTITGTIDFIFGNARAVLQNCKLLVRKPLENQGSCMVTAQGRTAINETSAIVLQNCRIMPAPEYHVSDKGYKTFLGRPWKAYSRTIIMDSHLDSLIHPEGWSPWNHTSAHLDTCYYAEVNNQGPGAKLTGRVKWPGIKSISIQEAERNYTPGNYMTGDYWIPGKGIPYNLGLIKN